MQLALGAGQIQFESMEMTYKAAFDKTECRQSLALAQVCASPFIQRISQLVPELPQAFCMRPWARQLLPAFHHHALHTWLFRQGMSAPVLPSIQQLACSGIIADTPANFPEGVNLARPDFPADGQLALIFL